MKRWTFRIVLCLLLGVVTTVGVAWGFEVADLSSSNWQDRLDGIVEFPNSRWLITIDERPGHLMLTSDAIDTSPDHQPGPFIPIVSDPTASFPSESTPPWSRINLPFQGDSLTDATSIAVEHASGFPLYSLRSTVFIYSIYLRQRALIHPFILTVRDDKFFSRYGGSQRLAPGDGVDGGLLLHVQYASMGGWPERIVFLPIRPILPGFIIDTLFYAVIWFGLIFGGRAHMRLIRRWQGHCPMCKYDLRGDLDTGCPECGWNREPPETP